MTDTETGSIWVVANQKGGVGKSTSSTNLAVGLGAKGYSVVIVDSDPNKKSASGAWDKSRKHLISELGDDHGLVAVDVKSTYGDIFDTVRALSTYYDYVIVDTAGLNSTEFNTAAITAHLIIVPTECDIYDCEKALKGDQGAGFSSASMVEMDSSINKLLAMNRAAKAVTFINKAPTRANASQRVETKKYLASLNTIKLCKNSISYFEKIFGEAASMGATVIESNHTKARAQYQMLLEELLDIDNS